MRLYLKTDFSKVALGFALCQPIKDKTSLKAMNEEMNGGECRFDLTLKGLRLLPVAFGSRRTAGNEKHLHSFPGEALAAAWAITKNRHFLWGREFTLLTDCRALLWIASHEGNNHIVKRMQLELTGYYYTITHRSGRMMADANYLSRLEEDTSIDPLLRDYLSFARQIYEKNKPRKNKPNSPGQSFKHYSPNTPIKLNVTNPEENDAFLGFGSIKLDHKPFLNLSENGDLNEAAFNLFNFLRKLDKLKKTKISIYPIPKNGIGKVINERLSRAKVNE